MISIIVTTQKFNYIPSSIRTNISMLISFNLSPMDWKLIKTDIILEGDIFWSLIKYIFKENDDFMIYRTDTLEYFKRFDKILLN